MNKYMFGCATLVFLLGIFLRQGNALLCWECNSMHDPRCAGEMLDPRTLGVTDCSQLERPHMKGMEAKYCRKIVQNIQGELRVIRGCGWLEDTRGGRGNCFSRTGTKDIMVTFCQCEGDKCNSSSTIKHYWLLITMLLIFGRLI